MLKLMPNRHLHGAYTYLLPTEPFFGLRPKLPDADAVRFVVSRERATTGYFRLVDGKPEIGISEVCVGSTDVLMRVMAHEMLHLYQWLSGTATPNTQHNAAFQKLAHRVCRAHVFDECEFGGVW